MGIPSAEILTFDSGLIHRCEYEETDSYQVTEMLINHKEHLISGMLGYTTKARIISCHFLLKMLYLRQNNTRHSAFLRTSVPHKYTRFFSEVFS